MRTLDRNAEACYPSHCRVGFSLALGNAGLITHDPTGLCSSLPIRSCIFYTHLQGIQEAHTLRVVDAAKD